ncbi:cytochrome-c peroxidase [Flavihumibacter solisilvae]|uniref:Cytochrome C peroxidase n=1 Tax=Flavihumibacter solisilvae TaxID=1349421 RepID=A0A0C1L236_9BACT|nr:cytochrome-c peroxidase [Flavihumibacter solisilvae]KIC94042.1 cytochrome C peroxidase [Flavihumibacter solisilvae]
MRLKVIVILVALIVSCLVMVESCKSPADERKPAHRRKEQVDPGKISALPETFESPAGNPTTAQKIELGRLLFYDPVLSGGNDVACATCHHPEFGYAESLQLSIGVNGRGLGEQRHFNSRNKIPFTKRNAQSLLNVAFSGIDQEGNYIPAEAPMFWDLRAGGLEEQAMMPVRTLEEMRGHGYGEEDITNEVAKRVGKIATYRKLFKSAFGTDEAVSVENISKALASFQRSLVANNSRFDRYMRGDKTAMSAREIEGMQLFISSGCARCHSGPMLSDYKTHVLGVAESELLSLPDSGFMKSFAFRTPTLRNLRFTRPYMHNGKIQTLNDVLTFYEDLPGKDLPNPHVKKEQLDTLAGMVKVKFGDINTIVEFLNTLNDEKYDRKIPESVPSGLPVGGNIH